VRDNASPLLYLSSALSILAAALLLTIAWLASAHAASADAGQSKQKAEWVTRCDRVKEADRFDCLDKLRAEARERYLKEEADALAKPASPPPAAKSPPKTS
jgi:hypothetical protein